MWFVLPIAVFFNISLSCGTLEVIQIIRNTLGQCFSTFCAPSPGNRQIFQLLSRSLFLSLKFLKIKAYKNVLFSSKYKENIGLLKLILTLVEYWLITIISNLFMSNLVNFKDSKTFQVPVRKHSGPGTGTRPGGWESLL